MILNGKLFMEEFFMLLTCIICFVTFISLQLYNYFKFKKEKNKKYWNKLIGINIAGFIFALIIFFVIRHSNDIDIFNPNKNTILGFYIEKGIIYLVISYILFFGANIILLMKTILIKKSVSTPLKLDKSVVINGITILLINTVIGVFVPILLFNQYINIAGQKNLKNLDEQYGKGNCKIVNVERILSAEGSSLPYLDGYKYNVKCKSNTETFEIRYNR